MKGTTTESAKAERRYFRALLHLFEACERRAEVGATFHHAHAGERDKLRREWNAAKFGYLAALKTARKHRDAYVAATGQDPKPRKRRKAAKG